MQEKPAFESKQEILFDIRRYPCYDFCNESNLPGRSKEVLSAKKEAPRFKVGRSKRAMRSARTGEENPGVESEAPEAPASCTEEILSGLFDSDVRGYCPS